MQNGSECIPAGAPLSPIRLKLLKRDVVQRRAAFEKALRSDKRLSGAWFKLESGAGPAGRGCTETGWIIVSGGVRSVKQKRVLEALIEQWRRKPTTSGRGIEIGSHV